LSEKAYRILRHKIVRLELKPGTLLNESGLVRELGMSRTPIREALQRLAHQKLVAILPRQGMLVPEITVDDIQQVYEFRGLIEGCAARLAAERITAEDLARLREVHADIEEAIGREDPLAFADQDERFHRLLAAGARNDLLEEAFDRAYALSLRLWFYFFRRRETLKETGHEHLAILAALESRQAGASERAMREHIANVQARVKAVL
jgi:DNA-binding GntR family transcriptional regulator